MPGVGQGGRLCWYMLGYAVARLYIVPFYQFVSFTQSSIVESASDLGLVPSNPASNTFRFLTALCIKVLNPLAPSG